jgi:hypothetical protein
MSEQNFVIFDKNHISGKFFLFSEKIICPEKINDMSGNFFE